MRNNCGEKWQGEADESVGSHLEQNARQDDGAGGGGFHVRIGQPSMEGKHRNLDSESNEERDKEPDCGLEGNQGSGLIELGNAEGENPGERVVMEVEI